MTNQMTRLDYCQYLLVTQINYTLTNFAEHSDKFSHDQINRFLKGEKITPRRTSISRWVGDLTGVGF